MRLGRYVHGRVVIVEIAEDVARGVAQLPIGIEALLDDPFADTNVGGVVDRRDP